MDADIELRKWAIEQAVLLHRQAGMTTGGLISEAGQLLAYVKPNPEPKKDSV